MTDEHDDVGGGQDARRRFSGWLYPQEPASYRAVTRRVDLRTVTAHVIAAGPHRFERTVEDVAMLDRPRIVTVVVGAGTATGTIEDRPFTITKGDVLVFDDRDPISYTTDEEIRFLRLAVDVGSVPDYLLQGRLLPAAVIRRTRLVNSAVAFVSALFAGPSEEQVVEVDVDTHLREALTGLAVAVIGEARSESRAAQIGPAAELRARIEAFVMDNLADPMLTPGVIAGALGGSVRYAHQVFNQEGTTLSRFIRDRRLDGVAALLRDGGADLPLGTLSERCGFGSRDQLSRGFRQRFGRTMGEYRAEFCPQRARR